MKLLAFVVLLGVAYAAGVPVNLEDQNYVLKYLTRFGYLGESELHNRGTVFNALKKLQKLAHIPETGIIDDATLKFTKKPRCGVPDVIRGQPRFDAQVPWNKRNITYHVGAITSDLTFDQVVTNMQKALDTWAAQVNLRFTRVSDVNAADIVSYFGSGSHGDPYPFDGPSGVLAHAFFPQNGDIHFDNDESWDLGGHNGNIDFFSVALHELGHSLGLGHSNIYGAVMYPTYSVWTRLHQDDINGIRTLYP